MAQLNKSLEFATALAQFLPKSAATRNGVGFCPTADTWSFQDGTFKVHIDFERVPSAFANHTDALKHTMLVFAQNSAPTYLQNLFESYLLFVRSLDPPDEPATASFGLAQVWQFIEKNSGKDAWRIGPVNVVLQRWHALGLPGVTQECVDFLRARRKVGNVKGRAVRTHDPVQGPFTEQEYVALYRAVDTAFGRGDLSQQTLLLTRLLFATGQRITQYASLKLCDASVESSPDGLRSYAIQIPQVKKRLAHAREVFETFDLSPQTGELLLEYIQARKLAADVNAQSPLFILPGVDEGQGLFKGHCTGKRLQDQFSREIERVAPPTYRLNGAPLPVSPRRFRYTLGTRMAQERYSLLLIAKVLGHADLQSAAVYIERTPQIIENIDKAMHGYLAPISQAFVGTVIEGDASSSRAGALGSRIYDFKVAKAPVGSCAGPDGCGFAKPVACYGCSSFEPWLDAPHEKLLARLLDERDVALRSHGERMAMVNDHTILAVQEVISQCAQINAQRNSSAGGVHG